MVKRLKLRYLAHELGMDCAKLKMDLYEYRKERLRVGGQIQSSLPSETTIRKWFSNEANPSREGLGFLLEFIHDKHENRKISYSKTAFEKIKLGANSIKGPVFVFDNLMIEESRRRQYHLKLCQEIESNYVGLYILVRERSNGELAVEPMLIMEHTSGNAPTHRTSYWIVGGYAYCGDIIFGYRSAGGMFVIKSTDKPLNPVCLNICLMEDESADFLSAKVATTNPQTGDIYSKNAVLLDVSERFDVATIMSQCREHDLDALWAVMDRLGSRIGMAAEVAEFVKRHTPYIRRHDALNLVNSINGPVLTGIDADDSSA